MISIVFIAIYIIIYSMIFSSFYKRDYWSVIVFILLLLTFSPMMQYVYFPEYKMDPILGYRQLPFKRVWLEYVHTIFLLYIYNKIPGSRANPQIKYFVVLYIILNTFQFLTALDFVRALNGFWMSVINPAIFGLIVSKVLSNHKYTETSIIKGIFRYYTIVYILFFSISVFNFYRMGVQYDSDYDGLFIYGLGSGLGVFRDRILMTNIFFFLPIICVPQSFDIRKNLKTSWFIFYIIGTFLILLMSNSRTMYAVTLLMILILTIFNPFKNRKALLKLILGIGILIVAINSISSSSDITEVITDRFTNRGVTSLESAKEDERYEIWEAAVKMSKETYYMGIGFANFNIMYTGRTGHYSNAHSMYYTTLAERGIGALLFLFAALFSIMKVSYKNLKNNVRTLPVILLLGTFCFSLVVYTGEDLFNVSQVAYSLPPYFIFLILGICFSYKNIKNEEVY